MSTRKIRRLIGSIRYLKIATSENSIRDAYRPGQATNTASQPAQQHISHHAQKKKNQETKTPIYHITQQPSLPNPSLPNPSPQNLPLLPPKPNQTKKKSTPNLPILPHPLLQTLRLFPRNLLHLIRNPRTFSLGNSHIQIRHIICKIRLQTTSFAQEIFKSVARKSDVHYTATENFCEDCSDLKKKKKLFGLLFFLLFFFLFFLVLTSS